MAKGLKVLANQLRKNHGIRLVPSFDDSIRPGSVVRVNGWNDITKLTELTSDGAISAADLGPVEGPTQLLLADFSRKHELNIGGALDLLQPNASARASFKKAKEAVATFESPVSYGLDLVTVEDAVERDPTFWNRNLAQRLRVRRNRVVLRTVKARLSFYFRGSGGGSVDLKAPVGSLSRAGLNTGWTWRNEATLESKKEILVGVELFRYVRSKKRFVHKP